ncbi:MAG: hypothetical protein KAT69_06710 [Candidatus Aminicenantes bacterium]|nr:hypothetical protein [Candidatus Aminicenantes bacterium]
MDKKLFVWLSDSCVARNGHELKKGKTHKVADFKPEIVEYWVKCKRAKYTSSVATKSKEEDN